MAIKYLDSSASGANNGSSWADAWTSIVSAPAGMAVGDDLYVAHDHTDFDTVSMTLTFPGNNRLISVNKSTGTPTVSINNITRGKTLFIDCGLGYWLFFWGLGFEINGESSYIMHIGRTLARYILIKCRLYCLTTSANSKIILGPALNGTRSIFTAKDLTFKFNNTGQNFRPLSNKIVIENFSLASGSTITTSLFDGTANTAGQIVISNSDLNDFTGSQLFLNPFSADIQLNNIDIASGVDLVNYTSQEINSGTVYAYNCRVGGSQIDFIQQSPFGKLTIDSGKYTSDALSNQSVLVTTTSLANKETPFESLWIEQYHDGVSSISPYFAIARDGNATAYTNNDVGAEFEAKTTAGKSKKTSYSDLCDWLATPVDQTTDTDTSWIGLGGTNWKGKVGEQALTPAEAGILSGRIVVGLANASFNWDTRIRF